MKRLLPALLFLAPAFDSEACPNLAEPEEILRSEGNRVRATALVEKVWAESDTVFIGRVTHLSETATLDGEVLDEYQTPNPPIGAVVDGTIRVIPLSELKGIVNEGQEFTYQRRYDLVLRSCTGLDSFRRVTVRPTYRYLFYVKNGEVLRANEVVDWFDDLDAETELKMLQGDS